MAEGVLKLFTVNSSKNVGVFYQIKETIKKHYRDQVRYSVEASEVLENDIRIWSIIVSIIFLILGLLNSKILTPFNKLWMRLGALLGIIVSPIVMGVVYFGIITPIGLIMKLFGKDVLNLKLDKNKKTYWTLKKKIPSKMKDQF